MNHHDLELSGGLKWTDVVAPTKDDLLKLAKETGLPPRTLLSSLDSEHLPKFEVLDDVTFLILRTVDFSARHRADCVEDLTTKIVLFLSPRGILTIHRLDPDFVASIREKAVTAPGQLDLKDLLRSIMTGTMMSYDLPITELERKADELEGDVFQGKRSSRLLRESYIVRRRGAAFTKVLQLTSDVMGRLSQRPEYAWPDAQDTRERMSRLIYYSSEIVDHVTVLLNLHLALATQKTNEASFRTNEIMRVLTIFSAFFLPLNFIAGIYGMNFDNMPELHWKSGYYLVLMVMATTAIGIYFFMRRNGWLGSKGD